LPDKKEDAAFDDVYIVKGDPTSEVVLRRASVPRAHSVVILADGREGKHADGKSVLTCITIRGICRGERQPNIAVECHNSINRNHLRKAGADEIISSEELGLRLLARSALFHGMTRVYQELLTVGRDANEMYLLPAPEGLVGKDFVELTGMFARHRDDRKSCLLIGIQRGDEMHLNPIGGEAGPLHHDDQLIVLCRVFLQPSQTLPTDPPMAPPGGSTRFRTVNAN
jgi:voltage-gated potassium channel